MKIQIACTTGLVIGLVIGLTGCTTVGALQGTPPAASPPAMATGSSLAVSHCLPTATARPEATLVPTCPPTGGQPPCSRVPTPLPSRKDICADAPIPVTMADAEAKHFTTGFFRMAFSKDTLIGAVREASQIKLYAVDLNSGATRSIGSSISGGISGLDLSERYVTWSVTRSVFVYDLQTGEEIRIETNSTYPAPTVSGNIIIWDGLQGFDINTRTKISMSSRFGAIRYPRISGDWVVSLDTIYDGPEWGHSAKLYAHNLTSHEEFLIGDVPMGNNWQGYFAVSDDRVAWVTAQDTHAIHVFDLTTHLDRVLLNPVPREKSHPSYLMLDGDILVYADDQWIGYDLSRDVAFSISLLPSDEWQGAGISLPHLSNERLVWILGSQLFTAQIVRGK